MKRANQRTTKLNLARRQAIGARRRGLKLADEADGDLEVVFGPYEQAVEAHDVRIVGSAEHVLNGGQADRRQVRATERTTRDSQVEPGLHQPPGRDTPAIRR